ncbi:MAG: hypothetical protein KBF93_12210 [Leptospiraceae bacterium]|nr:hypothetical protein [Leptospiraceae bacterium]
MNILEYTNIDTYPVNIEFFEAGGPVASNYKYITHIRVFSKSGKIFLNYREVREFLSGKPRLVVSNEKELSQEVYKEFLVDLLHHRILELNRNFIPKESNIEKPNFFSITLGDSVKVYFDYLLTNKDTSEFEPFDDIIQAMKNLLFSNLR